MAPGFDGITTWSPYVLDDGDAVPIPEPPPAAPERKAPSPGYLPPPIPVRPAPEVRPAAYDLPPEPEITPPPPPIAAVVPLAEPAPGEHVAAPDDAGTWQDSAEILDTAAEPADALTETARDDNLVWPDSSSSSLRAAAEDELSALDPWGSDLVTAPAPGQASPRLRIGRPRRGSPPLALARLAAGLAAMGLVAAAVFAGLRYLPSLFASGQTTVAILNAPMMVVRSAAVGRVVTVAAAASQIVEPASPLLTIHTDDGKADRAILAGVHGMVRSVETVPGAALVAGAPLVRLQDCDRAFLTVPPAAKLQAGQTVQVKLADQKPFPGTVRASSGVMEPPDSLVIGLEPGTVAATCPVGRSASVTPPGR